MKSFKKYLLTEFASNKSHGTEAMLVLQKVIDMVDDGHVDYSDKSIKINVGKLTKNKNYNGLEIIILPGRDAVKVGRHDSEDRHAIFIYTPKLPKRENIEGFLADKERSESFKRIFVRFINDVTFDASGVEDSAHEKSNNLNTRKAFEDSYIALVDKMNHEYEQYTKAKDDVDNRLSKIHDELGHKETIKLSLSKLKQDMIGSTVEEFKSKAINLYGKEEYKLLNKDFKAKLDSRLNDYYETKIK